MLIGLVLYFLSFVFFGDIEATLLEPRKKCVPTATVQGPCHECVCTAEGIFHCRPRACREEKYTNASIWRRSDLPEIIEGQKCIYGKTYRMDCNICRCGHRNSLLCTKMACLNLWPMRTGRQGKENNQKKKQKNNAKKRIKSPEYEKRRPRLLLKLKELPEGPCSPGKYYVKDCNKCYCTDEEVGVCSTKRNACGPAKFIRIKKPDDVRPPITDEEFEQLPILEHSAARCKPGKIYRVDCNPCICLSNLNLLCDKLLCISHDDIHRIAALKESGKPCNETTSLEMNCVRCSCNHSRLQCEAIQHCMTEGDRTFLSTNKHNNGSRIALNYMKEDCVPYAVYRNDCNKCYCQEDKNLRCTQKTCLNYAQVVQLSVQRRYLEKHGL